jgi:CBS domain-containing protein
MRTVRQILDDKGRDVWSVSADTPVIEAIELLAEKEVGALAIKDGEKLVGILSERDYARKIILKGRSSQNTLTREIMTTKVVFTHLDMTVEDCMALMSGKSIRHLPVLEDGKLIGMVSIRDLLRAIIADQQFTIEQLERYITS